MHYVIDTHSFVWYYKGESRFSDAVIEIFTKVENEQAQLVIPCIVFYELVYLGDKKKLEINFNEILNTRTTRQRSFILSNQPNFGIPVRPSYHYYCGICGLIPFKKSLPASLQAGEPKTGG